MTPTKAQAELLRWLVEAEQRQGEARKRGGYPPIRCTFSGGSLIPYYRERKQAELRGRPGWSEDMIEHARGGYADHGWRRAGGRSLRLLADKGYLAMTTFEWGVPQYVLTDAGREAVA